MNSGNLKFLEPSGPPQACNGTALPFTFYINLLISSCFLALNTTHYLISLLPSLTNYPINVPTMYAETTNSNKRRVKFHQTQQWFTHLLFHKHFGMEHLKFKLTVRLIQKLKAQKHSLTETCNCTTMMQWFNILSSYLNIVCTATMVLQSASVSSSAELDISLFTTTTFSDRVMPARSKSSRLQNDTRSA